MATVAILGDTHVPSRAPEIPGWVRDRVAEADHVVLVGDYDDADVLAELRELAGDPTAVRGNMDPASIDLPRVATLDVEDVRFVVTHGTGPPGGWGRRVVEAAREHAAAGRATVAVAGHTHEVVDLEEDDVRVLNPGSATGARPASGATMLCVTVEGDELDVEVLRPDGGQGGDRTG